VSTPAPAAPLEGAASLPPPGQGAGNETKPDESNDWFAKLEKQTGISKLWLTLGFVVLLWFLVVSVFGTHAFIHFVAFIYPAYMSFKTLERENDAELAYWLTYWVVYALFIMFEVVADRLLYWMPWYNPLKLLFLIWCFLPVTRGCGFLYSHCVRPLLHAHEERIDRALLRITEHATQASAEIKDISSEVFMAAASQVGRSMFVVRGRSATPPHSDDAAPPAPTKDKDA